jgi:hypothetical protein
VLDVRPSRQRAARSPGKFAGKWPLYALYLAAAGLLAAGGVALFHARPAESTANQELISVGQGFVRNAIREEWKTTFGGDEETRVEALPGHKFLVAGWVDIVSESGQSERQDFSCVIYKSDNDGWVGEKIAVIPQHL